MVTTRLEIVPRWCLAGGPYQLLYLLLLTLRSASYTRMLRHEGEVFFFGIEWAIEQGRARREYLEKWIEFISFASI